ncbi:MAG: hypothetical protein AABX50_02425 [Nanoarchaeota archaeon]
MEGNLENEVSSTFVLLDEESLARLQKTRERIREDMRYFTDPVRESGILTAEDYMFTINC